MARPRSVLRIQIDGQWTVTELGETLTALSDLYDLLLSLERGSDRGKPPPLAILYDSLWHFSSGPYSSNAAPLRPDYTATSTARTGSKFAVLSSLLLDAQTS
jgi:hypothetical protein